jgi:hypothetical protein
VIVVTAVATSSAAQGTQPQNGIDMKYPDWSGQWQRIGSLNWPPEGYAKAGPAPLTPEYKAIYDRNQK